MSARSRSVIAAALVALLLAACGQARTERSSVTAYIRQVERVEQAMSPLLKQTTRAVSQFATEQHHRASLIGNLSMATAGVDLHSAVVRLEGMRSRLATIPAPPAAGHLRVLVLRLADAQTSLARQVGQLVRFLAPFGAAVGEVPPAIRQLQAVLAQSGTFTQTSAAVLAASKASALERFGAQMRHISRQLSRLSPPPISLPGYRTEVRSVNAMGAAATHLAGAMSAGSAAAIPAQLEAFDRAATLGRTTAAQRAQIAAVRAYDRQVAGLNQLVLAIDQERARLDQTLA